MASPQIENGYTKIANELLEALSRHRMAGQENQIMFAIMRKTFGFNKITDSISCGQISEMTGLDRRRVHFLVHNLADRKILAITNNGDRKPLSICINKNYDEWVTVTKNGDITNNGDSPDTNNGGKSDTNNGAHKRKKEIKEIPSTFFSLSESFLKYQQDQFGESVVKITPGKIKAGAETIEQLCRIDGFDFNTQIKPALSWAVKDAFWSKQIRSLASLRKSGKNGESKFRNLFVSFQIKKPKEKYIY